MVVVAPQQQQLFRKKCTEKAPREKLNFSSSCAHRNSQNSSRSRRRRKNNMESNNSYKKIKLSIVFHCYDWHTRDCKQGKREIVSAAARCWWKIGKNYAKNLRRRRLLRNWNDTSTSVTDIWAASGWGGAETCASPVRQLPTLGQPTDQPGG